MRADRRLLERAIVNLLENALQAVGEAGSIRVSLRTRDEGRRVEIEVRDSGPGVAPEVRDRIFEPFFSTKTSGSGLGLALVKKIAEDHGGGVSLESTAGEPTRALLWLPRGEEPSDATATGRGTRGSGDGASRRSCFDSVPYSAWREDVRDACPTRLSACLWSSRHLRAHDRRIDRLREVSLRAEDPEDPGSADADPRSRSAIPAATSFICPPFTEEMRGPSKSVT